MLSTEASFRTTGKVKWFDPVKGYGFIVPDEPDEFDGDVLLHMSVLRSAGFSTVPENARIVCEAVRGQRGAQATRVLELDDSAHASEDLADALDFSIEDSHPVQHGDLLPVRVKWFDRAKGFGFGNMIGDASDIFIHMETLRRYGLPDLAPGEAVLVRALRGPRGMMATEVRPWDHSFRQ